MNNTWRSVAFIVITLGVIGVALNILFGNKTMIFVQRELIEGTTITWYKFNTIGYIKQLQTAITDTTSLELQIPLRQWDSSGSIGAVSNNLLVILDYIIMIINVLIYPMKIGGYALRFILALIGLNFNDPESSIYWLGELSRRLIELNIRYL